MIRKKILIISDNYPLSIFLINFLKKKKISYELFHTKLNNKLKKIGSVFISLKNKQTQNKILKSFKLLISVHCHTIIPKIIIDKILCINFHPGYNPYNRGMFPQIFSIINNKPLGATVHLMTNKIDIGPIIERKKITSYERDTSFDLYNKIIEIQKKLIEKNIPKIINNNFKLKEINNIGNYNSKKDFNKLCKLDLDNKDTFKNHIKILKALSHKGYKNAYYIKNKKKIFIEINFL
jgi:methionyl-tRNA formyltransferase